jgi:sulfur-oxidizing protein SoxB
MSDRFPKARGSRLAATLVFVVAMAFGFGVSAGEVTEIRIISTNDLHSYLRPVFYRYLDVVKPWGFESSEGDYVNKAELVGKIGGMAHVATMINQLRAEKPDRSLLVDAGDTFHGAGISVFDKGYSVVKIMNAIGYEVMTPGNWEFLYPKDHLLDLIDKADFPVIAYNVTDKDWDEPVFEQYVIKEVGELKLAVIGLTYPWTALTSSISGAAQWWKFGIKEEEARDLIDEIREEHEPDLIVVVSHGGYGLDQKFAKRVDGIDVLVSGHTHDEIYDPVVWNDTIIYQGGAHGKFVTKLDVRVKDKKVVGYTYDLMKVRQSEIEPDPKIAKMIDEAYAPHEKKLSEVVGETKKMIYRRDYFQSPMGNLLTDAMREMTGADIAFFPAWRYGATLMPGKITAEDVYNLVPTDGKIITYSMPGKSVKRLINNILNAVVDNDPYSRVGGDMIRFSGMKLVYDLSKPDGQRIASLSVGDEPVSDSRVYKVASVHTRFQNSPLFGATNIEVTDRIFVEELVDYIRGHSPINTPLDDRIAAVNASS